MTTPSDREVTTALREVAGSIDNATGIFHDLRDTMLERTDEFRRLLRILVWLILGLVGATLLMLVSTYLLISALVPWFPGMRIYEESQKRTAEVVTVLNCNVQWSNDKRVLLPGDTPTETCEAVYRALDSLPRFPAPEGS